MRPRRTIGALAAALDEQAEALLPDGIVPFPRGFGFGDNGLIYLSSGVVRLSRLNGQALVLVE